MDPVEMHLKGLSGYNDKGEEIPDPTPSSLHISFRRPEPLADRIRRMVRSENLRSLAEAEGLESFDEADDFEVPEDLPDGTPYEDTFEPTVAGITAREQEIRAGIVEEMPSDKILKAKEVLEKWRKARNELGYLAQEKKKLEEKPVEPAKPA